MNGGGVHNSTHNRVGPHKKGQLIHTVSTVDYNRGNLKREALYPAQTQFPQPSQGGGLPHLTWLL